MTINYIDDDTSLVDVISELANRQWLAIDTEFMRDRTYYPKLCLLQIGYADNHFCIDTLAELDLGALLELICEQQSARVLHAARQDLEIFYHLTGKFIGPLFDTQIAAGLLGFDAQIGYAALVKDLLGVELKKGHQRTDWSKRPLSIAQLHYATDDVRYLGEIYPLLHERLESLGRLQWAIQDCGQLLNENLYIIKPEKAYKRIGQIKTLPAAEQLLLRRLAAWRESIAQSLDRPRNWIASDNTLVFMAHSKPNSVQQLESVKGLSQEIIDLQHQEILQTICETQPDIGLVDIKSYTPLSEAEQKRYQTIKKRLGKVADELNIQQQILATRKDIELMLRRNTKSSLFQGWRKEVVGDKLLDLY